MNNFSDLTCTRLSQALGKPKREREREMQTVVISTLLLRPHRAYHVCVHFFIVCFRNSLLLVVVRCWARVEVGLG